MKKSKVMAKRAKAANASQKTVPITSRSTADNKPARTAVAPSKAVGTPEKKPLAKVQAASAKAAAGKVISSKAAPAKGKSPEGMPAPKAAAKNQALAKPARPVATKKTTVSAAKKQTKPATKQKNQLRLVNAKSAAQDQSVVPALAKATAGAVRILQIYYRPDQRAQLDPDFEPYNNQGDSSPLLEFNVFRKLVQSKALDNAALWGALSWKFGQKTGLSGQALRQTIAANPGFDVYYCNPYPEMEGQYHNLWLQGETSHPNFLVLCQEFFECAGLPTDVFNTCEPSQNFAASNYFVASPAFWRAYMGFVGGAIVKADAKMSKTARAMLYSATADRTGAHAEASYLPFIVERLFAVFLRTAGSQFKAYKYDLPAKTATLNVHQQLLAQMKDSAIKNKSLWLATCWVNYRNLYLNTVNGAAWVKRYLKAITPTQFKYPS